MRNDWILGPPGGARVVYRVAPSLRVRIAPNVIDTPVRTTFFHNLKGYYPCRKCNVCHHNTCGRRKSDMFKSTTTNPSYQMKHFTTCTTKNIVYLLNCPCKNNVGRTICLFSVKVNEHIANIKKGFLNYYSSLL